MQFQRKKTPGSLTSVGKILMKLALVIFFFFFVIIFIDRIDLPAPNKKIEKSVPNENFKIIK